MTRFIKTQWIASVVLFMITLMGCSDDQPGTGSGSGSDLTYTVDGKKVSMYSVSSDVWDNQDDKSLQVKIQYVIDPTFKNKTTNDGLMLGIWRLSKPGSYELGGNDDNQLVFVQNGMESAGSYDTFWESVSGTIEVTEATSRGTKGTFSGILIKKKYQGMSIVTIPGSEMKIENGSFACNY